MNGSASDPTIFPRSDERLTCPSSIGHSTNVIDHLCHYGACIDISQRASYFKDADLWASERDRERVKLVHERGWPHMLTGMQAREVEHSFKKTMFRTALEVDRELKRIEVLRHEIDAANPNVTKRPNVGLDLRKSMARWRGSSEYKDNIDEVWKWRLGREPLDGEKRLDHNALPENRVPEEDLRRLLKALPPSDNHTLARERRQLEEQLNLHCSPTNNRYDLEKDSKAYIIEWTYRELKLPGQYSNTPGPSTPLVPGYFPIQETGSSSGYAKRNESEYYLDKYSERQHPSFSGSFPSQKVSMADLLTKRDIVQPKTGRVRYIHIPTNNMEWVEQVIAQYYGEKTPNFDKILRTEYWRGQQHGGMESPVHSRHLMPMCETPSMDNGLGDGSRTLALFMPYLHWETNRKRSMMADVIFSTAKRYRERKEMQRAKDRDERLKRRMGLPKCGLPKIKHEEEKKGKLAKCTKPEHDLPDIGAVANELITQLGLNFQHQRTPRHPLASVLMDAAKLYERMALFRDEMMVEKYLFNGPLHPRRTLDQSYYWTLRSTETRDRDQVVFRQTRPRGDHVFSPQEKPSAHTHILKQFLTPKMRRRPRSCPSCQQEKADQCRCGGKERCVCLRLRPLKDDHTCGDCMKGWGWTHHTDETDLKGCEHCRDDVQKLTRTIMVDQLWMWILDENTILTCYPKRYGINKPDPSGVHKSIRMRLKTMPQYELRSAYDLALIILDECSNTFFDRAKAPDNQPRLTDIFSESIGRIAYNQTVLFEHLWHWTKEANRIYRSRAEEADSTRLHVPLLDIRREGKLQREIKDIIDELDMMMYLGAQQAKVLKRFKRLVQQMLSPVAAYKEPDRDLDILPALKTRTESGLEDGARAPLSPGHGEQAWSGPGHDHPANRRKKYSWFSNHATVLMADVEDRMAELEGLKKSALSAAENIKELLSLKQQQASVVQAYESVRQAEETVKQGRSIMMFTIVTIIFLPLSFTSSVFGMNAVEFSEENEISLKTQMPIMFGVSGFVIAVTLVVAFSSLVRSVIWSFFTYTSMRVAVSTGAYGVWLRWGRTSRGVDAMTIREVERMKQVVEKKMRDCDEEEEKEAKCKKEGHNGKCECPGSSTAVGSRESLKVEVQEHEQQRQGTPV